MAHDKQAPQNTLDSPHVLVHRRGPLVPRADGSARQARWTAWRGGAAARACPPAQAPWPFTPPVSSRVYGDTSRLVRATMPWAHHRCERSACSMAARHHAIGLLVLCAVLWSTGGLLIKWIAWPAL